MGVASVGLLHATVRRTTRSAAAGLVAGAVLALTPVATLMFRFNNQVQGLAVCAVGLLVTSGSLWLLHAATSTPGRFTEVAVLTGANLFVTVMRFVALRVSVFAPTLIRLSA
jgi:hypothetical protein